MKAAKCAWPFQEPVDTKQVVDYLQVIKEPMGMQRTSYQFCLFVFDMLFSYVCLLAVCSSAYGYAFSTYCLYLFDVCVFVYNKRCEPRHFFVSCALSLSLVSLTVTQECMHKPIIF